MRNKHKNCVKETNALLHSFFRKSNGTQFSACSTDTNQIDTAFFHKILRIQVFHVVSIDRDGSQVFYLPAMAADKVSML